MTIIARTQEKESCSEEGVVWWREFRVRKITNDEYHRLNLDCPYQQWLLEDRYLCRLPDGQVMGKFGNGSPPQDASDVWRPWNLGKTKEAVVWDVLGDTSFQEAVSLCELHRRLVKEFRLLREAQDAAYNAEKLVASSHESLESFKREETRKFYKAHGDKAGPAFDKAKERTLKRTKPYIEKLCGDRENSVAAWKQACSRLEEAKKRIEMTLKTSLPLTECDHNSMVATENPDQVWKCADCDYVYQ